jgi:hypothetical protein
MIAEPLPAQAEAKKKEFVPFSGEGKKLSDN